MTPTDSERLARVEAADWLQWHYTTQQAQELQATALYYVGDPK